MNRLVWRTILWAIIVLATSNSDAIANSIGTEENNHKNTVNIFLNQQKNGLSQDPPNGITQVENVEKVEDVDETIGADDELYNEAIRKQLRKNKITDILVAIFFFIAAVWLILATGYSIILLILLRLQARGELDIYDENLGRVVLFNGKVTLHFGCILRRYAIQLEEDYQRQLQRRFGDSNTENEEPQRIRIMTREERRNAVEELLGGSAKTLDIESGNAPSKKECTATRCTVISKTGTPTKASCISCPNTSLECSDEGPVCSICLVEYEPNDSVFRSKSCPHMFHGECLFSWLERRNNTECPCCREPLVSDDDIWDVVQRMRKERRQELRKENGLVHRFVNWAKSKNRRTTHPAVSSVETDRTDSSSNTLSEGSEDQSAQDQEPSSSTSRETETGDAVSDNADDGVESSSENNV